MATTDITAVQRKKILPFAEKQRPPWERRPSFELVLLFTSLFAAALARQRFLHTLLLARLEVKGVTLHFLNDVLLLNLAFKAPQGIF